MELRQALIDEQIATPAQVDEALARQSLYGGDVITNLLELAPIDEGLAQRTLARVYGMQIAPSGELPYASAAAIELVPRDVATSLGVYPFRLEQGVLSVVTGEPLSDSAGIEIGFALKVELRSLLALAPRVKQAIARDYAFALDKRSQKALARLERRAPLLSSRAPNPLTHAPSLSELPRPHSVVPVAFPTAWSESLTPTGGQLLAETAPQPEVVLREQLASEQAHAEVTQAALPSAEARTRDDATGAPPASSQDPRTARRRGPYTPAQAKKDLRDASTPQQVLEVYFDYAAQYFDHAAVFTVHSDEARLRHIRGLASTTLRRRVQVSTSPLLSTLVRGRPWLTAQLSKDDPQLAASMGSRGLKQGILLPVRVKRRCALVLYGEFLTSDVTLSDAGELLAFEPLVSQALEHAILIRKSVRPGKAACLPSAPAPRYARPSMEDTAHAVANLLTASAFSPSTDHAAGTPPTVAPRADDFSEPIIRQSAKTEPLIRQSTNTEAVQDPRGLAASGSQPSGAPGAAAVTSRAPALPLLSQPPGVYAEELEEARDSGWDVEL